MKKIKEAIDGKIPLDSLDKKIVIGFLKQLKAIFKNEPQVIKLPKKELIFAGDTHSDYEASMTVINKFLDKQRIIVFIGDYVDRAREPFADIRNILYLFYMKLNHPKQIILLRGNHEDAPTNAVYGFKKSVNQCWNLDMWQEFNDVFTFMPLVAVTDNIIALHGGLPEVATVKQIKDIPKGLRFDENVLLAQILWNDGIKSKKRIIHPLNRGVPAALCYGEAFFEEIMNNLHKNILIRAHDPEAKGWVFHHRCLTLMTSKLYTPYPYSNKYCDEPIQGRMIAVAPRVIKNPRDIKVIKI